MEFGCWGGREGPSVYAIHKGLWVSITGDKQMIKKQNQPSTINKHQAQLEKEMKDKIARDYDER